MQEGTVTASQHELVTGFLERLFAPDALAGLVLVIGIILALGLVSAHYIRQQRDFEHKEEMLWGAHWFWAVILAAEILVVGGTYLGLTHTLYTFTVAFIGMFLGPTMIALCVQYLPYQFTGAMVIFFHWAKILRREELNIDEWVRKQCGRSRKRKIWQIIATGMHAAFAVLWALTILTVAYPLDRMSIQSAEAERVAVVVEKQLRSPNLLRVTGYPRMMRFELPWTQEGLQVAGQSLKEILHIAPAAVPPAQENEYWWLFIKLSSATTREQAEDVGDRAKQALEEMQHDQYWRIFVFAKDRDFHIQRYYPKKTHTEPPEGDLSGPTTLDSGGQKQ
ncbi:MAG: hypothetical protein R6V19_10930 [Armatimonadota bacterium]